MNRMMKLFFTGMLIICVGCNAQPSNNPLQQEHKKEKILTGADQTGLYLQKLKGKNIGLVVNQTSRIGNRLLPDTLLALGIGVKKIFAPEHGFRGKADAGEKVDDETDPVTGLPVISLYGQHKKPTPEDLKGLDLVIFDIQDVGVRFYTYIYTMTYVMEACAENGIPVLILDRPNPNGHYVEGPVMQSCCTSFIGMHPVPVVHGMTIAEYANMANGEGWLKNGVKCNLDFVLCKNYDHNKPYDLPVRPSPNLPNMRSVYLYPSLCFFEGTSFSVGRGTGYPFQVFGHPGFKAGDYTFTPRSMEGASNPKFKDQPCKGISLAGKNPRAIRDRAALTLKYLINSYRDFEDKGHFFNKTFTLLAGNHELQEQIEAGLSEMEIRITWTEELENYKQIRKKYLLYRDFTE
jgi:uncharacterized protein YbbC (DUF1343 family)